MKVEIIVTNAGPKPVLVSQTEVDECEVGPGQFARCWISETNSVTVADIPADGE